MFLGSLLSTLEFVDLSLQAFQLSAFGRLLLGFTLLGLPLLCLQPVGLDALLTAALALQPFRFLGLSLSSGLESLFLFNSRAFGSQLSSRGLLGLGLFGLAVFSFTPDLVEKLQLLFVCLGTLSR